ncbi:TIGR03089 family protein [Cellulomonas dongxiuzhuiae]|uniref:TIGR03089 family protein n=1 Tax=Cellulomonas dongxiuzhuiae TaxID=2819979 RepID=UPI001FB914E3|nr:TIGR03089 family protein [Cellulomonas dongxiuzhuiae]
MQTHRALSGATVADLMSLLERDPGRPRITWYAQDGERVELSGAVLANWVSKTTNLLVEELDVAPGTRVRLDLPPHWRTLVWALAVWRCGACVVLGAHEAADVVVTDRPAEIRGPAVVGVALAPLARAFGADLPADAVDGTAVLAYADTVGWTPGTERDALALVAGGTRLSHGDLLAPGATTDAPGDRVALAADDRLAVLLQALAAWRADGSVVLVDAPTAAELRRDPGRRTAVLGPERVTVDLLVEAPTGSTTGADPAPRRD